MRLRNFFLAAAIPSATALHQRVVAHSAGAVDMTTQGLSMIFLCPVPFGTSLHEQIADEDADTTDFTATITKAPPPLESVMPNKPTVEASIMGLIVFSAAGLVLL